MKRTKPTLAEIEARLQKYGIDEQNDFAHLFAVIEGLIEYPKVYIEWRDLYEVWAKDQTIENYANASDAWDEVEKAKAALLPDVRERLP